MMEGLSGPLTNHKHQLYGEGRNINPLGRVGLTNPWERWLPLVYAQPPAPSQPGPEIRPKKPRETEPNWWSLQLPLSSHVP